MAGTTGVLKLSPSHASRSENMFRFARAALELIEHLQTKQPKILCAQCAMELAMTDTFCRACGSVRAS
eukprot:6331000-Prymnesium_polylepis.2